MFSGTQAVCGHLPFRVRALLDIWILAGGRSGSTERIAHSLGFRDRFEVGRILQCEGLPPLRRARSWMRVLAWVDHWERTGQSLCSQALSSGLDPGSAYHLIKRLTGLPWGQVAERGSAWVLNRFLSERAHTPTVGGVATADCLRLPSPFSRS